MSSTVKNGWWLVAGTLGFSLVLLIVPSIVFSKEIKQVNGIWYFVLLRIVSFVGWLYLAIRTIINREDPAMGGQRALTIGIALLYCIITCAGAAQYRSDKSDNIEFDEKTSQV